MIETLWNAAKAGNVTAMRTWLQLNGRDMSPGGVIRPKREPKLGKKEQLAREAQTGHQGSDWSELLH